MDAVTTIDDLLQTAGVKLGARQRARLGWLVARLGAPCVLTQRMALRQGARLVIVTEPMNGAGAETFFRSLGDDSVVVIPFGEHPEFDFLKSKLIDYGTVGPCGADGPHEMWWGGIGAPEAIAGRRNGVPRPRVVSCYPAQGDAGPALRLQRMVAELNLEQHVEPITGDSDDRLGASEIADFVSRMWRRYAEPLLFVDAAAQLRGLPLLPARMGCDVALHKWNRWEMSARTLYLGRSDAARKFLDAWQRLAADYPSVWDGYLIDQAWCLASSQASLDTVWLPRGYHAATGDVTARRPVIVHDLVATSADLGPDAGFASIARAARRAGRTGARDAMLVMKSAQSSTDSVAVIVKDIKSATAGVVAATIDATTDAFARDCGGFGRLELTLCAWETDAEFAREAACGRSRIVEIMPGQPVRPDFFADLSRSCNVVTHWPKTQAPRPH